MGKDWLAQKRIVIIGGTDGLGLSASLACIAEGASVVAAGRTAEQAELAQRQFGENGKVVIGDATDESVSQKALDTCISAFGGVDAVYHIAGGSGRRFGDGPLHEMTAEGWEKTLQMNLTSLMYSNKSALNYFLAQNRGGVILNMGSVLGFSPSPRFFTTHAYAACKSAIIGLTKSIAACYAKNNIRANVLAPGLVKTPMATRAVDNDEIMHFIHTKQPLDGGRVALPEDCDGAAVFLLSDQSKFITGQVIAVDGGWSVSEGQY